MKKLVRDKIPDIIAQEGRTVTISKIVNDGAFVNALHAKLDEEVAEYHESRDPEEIVDIIEVLLTLAQVDHHMTENMVNNAINKKHDSRGGFSKRYFLEEIK